MPIRVGELGADQVHEELVAGWRDSFPHAGHVVELTLDASSAERAEALAAAWSRLLSGPAWFVDYNPSFPLLVSFAVRFDPNVPPADAAECARLVGDVWAAARVLDGAAHVVGQAFTAYGFPAAGSVGSATAGLSRALACFRRSGLMGNLSYPIPEGSDERVEFFDPVTGEEAPPEAGVWRSDLSVSELTVAFAAAQDFDPATEAAQLKAQFGAPTNDLGKGGKLVLEWNQELFRAGREIGTAALLVAGPFPGLNRCGVSVEAWKCFGLPADKAVVNCYSRAQDIRWLLPVGDSQPAEVDGPGVWSLPARRCYEHPVAVGLSFTWK